MPLTRNESRSLARTAYEALEAGDPDKARSLFREIVAGGRPDAVVFTGLAMACRALGDREGLVEATEQVLAVEPGNLQGLLLKAERLAADGDRRAASVYYDAAVRRGEQFSQLPPQLAAQLEQARQESRRYRDEYESHLRQQLAGRGLAPGQIAPRMEMALDILFGTRSIYLQQPRYFYFPGLPQIQFYPRAAFPWLDGLEAATADIREELLEVMRDPAAFSPYVEGDPNRPRTAQPGMIGNPDWGAFYLWRNGEAVQDHLRRCPRTAAAVEGLPLARIPGRSPSVLFSLLRPGAHIPAHHGMTNTRLICHLPLVVPPGCEFRVGNETREWREGQVWVFDDTIEHEAWNRSDATRVVLLFEVWRPELDAAERAQLCELFGAIDAYGGAPARWEI